MPASPKQQPHPVPRHIAIIMDGNGRWAKRRLLPRIAGHRRGAEAIRNAVSACGDLGVEFLTIYAFSSENWKRPAEEVNDLMGLLRRYLREEIAELHRANVRLRFIGDRTGLARDIVDLVNQAETVTHENSRLTLVIALNYGSHAEIVAAARHLANEVAAGRLDPAKIDEAMFARALSTSGIPDPDLLIRTSGEKRLSNFLLWQAAYTELVFVDTLWPDFDRSTLEQAIQEYQTRDRRFGATSG